MTADHTQRIVDQWAGMRPNMDTSGMAAVLRVMRAARLIEFDMVRLFAHFGLNRGEFDVLVSLLRAGPPHKLTPTALSHGLLLSTSAMTNRLDRLEAAGLIARERDPDDRRGVLVQLTDLGLQTIGRVLEVHLPNIERLVEPLCGADLEAFNGLLARLLCHLETLDEHLPAGATAVPQPASTAAPGAPALTAEPALEERDRALDS